MAELTPKPIADLGSATSIGNSDYFPMSQGSTSKKVTGEQLKFLPYGVGTSISSGDDLNDYKTPGLYCCLSGSTAPNILNAPITDSHFRLEVSAQTSGSAGYIMQVVTSAYKKAIFYRRGYPGTNNYVWTDWIRLVHSDDLPLSIANGGTGATDAESACDNIGAMMKAAPPPQNNDLNVAPASSTNFTIFSFDATTANSPFTQDPRVSGFGYGHVIHLSGSSSVFQLALVKGDRIGMYTRRYYNNEWTLWVPVINAYGGATLQDTIAIDSGFFRRNVVTGFAGRQRIADAYVDTEDRGGMAFYREAVGDAKGDALWVGHAKTINGTAVFNRFCLHIADDGSKSVDFYDSTTIRAWLKGLGVMYLPGDTTFDMLYYIQIGGLCTSSGTAIHLDYVPERDMSGAIQSVTVTKMTGSIISANGNIEGSNSTTNWLEEQGVTVSARRIHARLIRIILEKSTGFSNAPTTNAPLTTYMLVRFSFS